MKKKFLAVIIVWMFLFIGCSEGHKRHRGHPVMRRSYRPYCRQVRPLVYHRGPKMVIGYQAPKIGQRGPYRGQRGLYGSMRGKGTGKMMSKGYNKSR